MKWKLRKCPVDKTYTMKEVCPKCGNATAIPHPPRFSPVDKYVKYRLESKLNRKLNC